MTWGFLQRIRELEEQAERLERENRRLKVLLFNSVDPRTYAPGEVEGHETLQAEMTANPPNEELEKLEKQVKSLKKDKHALCTYLKVSKSWPRCPLCDSAMSIDSSGRPYCTVCNPNIFFLGSGKNPADTIQAFLDEEA